MGEFILDDNIEKVKSIKVKNYLKEVRSTYYNGEYRSCIVILYVVTIFDMLEKIQIQAELYNIQKSKDYIEKYKKEVAANKKYSDIEKDIIEFSMENGIITNIEKSNIEQLRELRNHCAHPSTISDIELYMPNKDQVRAYIRNMFESLFLKDSIINKSVHDVFMSKLVDYYDRNYIDNIDDFITQRFYSKFDLQTKKWFLKKLWLYTFYGNDEQCQKYRQALYRALICLIKTDYSSLMDFINSEKTYLNSKIAFDVKPPNEVKIDDKKVYFFDCPSFALVYVIAEIPEILKYLSSYNIIELKMICNKNVNLLLMGYYLFSNQVEHSKEVYKYIQENDLNYCLSYTVFHLVNKIARV